MATTVGTASWGVTGKVSVSGIVTDIEISDEAQMAPEYNEIGAICRQTHYDTIKTARATIEVASGAAAPEVGAQIQICGKPYICKSASVIESNSAYRKISVTGEASKNVNTATKV